MVTEIARYFDGSRRCYNFKGPWDAVKEADLNAIEELWKESKCESLDNIYPFHYIPEQEELVAIPETRVEYNIKDLNLLQYAAHCGRYDCCELLLRLGADVNAKNKVCKQY